MISPNESRQNQNFGGHTNRSLHLKKRLRSQYNKLVQSEQQIRESEEKYRKIIENAPYGMHFYELNPEKGLVFTGANPSADSILGVRHDQFIGKTIEDVFPGLAGTEFPHGTGRLQNQDQSGTPNRFFIIMDRSAEHMLSPHSRQRPASWPRCLWISPDRKRTEDELRESEELLRLFIEHAPAALAMLDKELCYIAASSRWIADNHLGDRDLIGHSHLESFPELTEKIRDVFRRSLAGEITSAHEDTFERLDGSVQWLAWEVRPWYTAGHEIGGVIIFSEDITRRKNAEMEFRKSDEKYRQLFEIGGDALFVSENVTGKIIEVNEAATRMYGYSRDELLTLCNSDLSTEPGKTLGIMAIDSEDRVKVPCGTTGKKTVRSSRWKSRSVFLPGTAAG